MADTGLQRSVTSFRRQGSSGLVWDDKFIQNLNQNEENQREEKSDGPSETLKRSRSVGARPYRTVNVAAPSIDPPSPKVSTCGLCGFFSKKPVPKTSTRKSKPKSRKHR
ncbi:hypothetical protein Lalb_Chr13g0301951 [Lupinus albus]|uniref:MAPK kinase substrate protein n=1 Tax=Lupinus albus TaxID=3870 RepID=A0A6A4PK55_LUPAL|nr:hypothetical protein Lalb_Chr13g0301951 [Lupinus albus]